MAECLLASISHRGMPSLDVLLVVLFGRESMTYRSIVSCSLAVLVFLLSACASTEPASTDTEVRERGEVYTGSRIPRRDPNASNVKVSGKDEVEAESMRGAAIRQTPTTR